MRNRMLLSLIIFCVLSIIGTSFWIYQKQLPQKKVEEHFHEFARTIRETTLYKKVEDIFEPIGTIALNTPIHFQGIDKTYYQLSGTSYFVYYEDVEAVEPFALSNEYDHQTTIPDQTILRSVEGLLTIHIRETITLPVERLQNDYFVIFNQMKYRLLTNENIVQTYETPAKEIPVLMYHFFNDGTVKREKDSMFVDVRDFKEQMDYLKNNNYYTPTIKEFRLFLEGKLSLPEKSVLITMDDGATSVYQYAYPILKENQLRAVLFIITSKISDWDPNTMTSWHLSLSMYETLKADPLIELNSHSHNMHGASANKTEHRIDRVSLEWGIEDLQASAQFLGNTDSFCYPFGIYNDDAKEMLRQVGFPLAFTTSPGKVASGDDALTLKRMGIYKNTSLNEFIKIVTP